MRLVADGQPDVLASDVQVLDPTFVTAEFDVACLSTGLWRVAARNPGSPEVVGDDTLEITACVICPPGATPEGEPWCLDPDTFNGGCNSSPPVFSSITCGDTICGTAWAENDLRDTDWYELVLTEARDVTIWVDAELPVAFGIAETVPAGSGDCADWTGYISPYALADLCAPSSVEVTLQPGTHWIELVPQYFSGSECAAGPYEYALEVTCTARGRATPPAAPQTGRISGLATDERTAERE